MLNLHIGPSTEQTCAYCGQRYPESQECPNDAQHWEDFMESMTAFRPDSRPVAA